jgi:hypothetical protein
MQSLHTAETRAAVRAAAEDGVRAYLAARRRRRDV